MALSFGENLGVLGNIKLTDVKLVAGAFRTIASGSDTGSITVQRVEDGQIIYIQSEDRLIKATKSGASVNWSDFSFPSSGSQMMQIRLVVEHLHPHLWQVVVYHHSVH